LLNVLEQIANKMGLQKKYVLVVMPFDAIVSKLLATAMNKPSSKMVVLSINWREEQ
jgi:hypothetical protein